MQLNEHQTFDGGGSQPFLDPAAPTEGASGFEKVLNGLMAVLDTERAALEDTAQTDFNALTRQKLQLLMQLDRLSANKPASMPKPVTDKLAEARTRLDENARMLRHRMDAIREIADLISEEIRDADSDGTYSVGARF